jgi:hypothetical protein
MYSLIVFITDRSAELTHTCVYVCMCICTFVSQGLAMPGGFPQEPDQVRITTK